MIISPGGRMTARPIIPAGRSGVLMDHLMELFQYMQPTWMEMEM